MSYYKPKKIKPLRLVAMVLRGIARSFSAWPLILIAAIVVSPISPHMRWNYHYQDFGSGNRIYTACEYLGARGYVSYMRDGDCPFITLVDRR